LAELKRRRAGDLNAVLTTFNDGSLCREAVWHWLGNGWIVIAPHTPLVALAGPKFTRDLTLRSFCGEPAEIWAEEPMPETKPEVTGGEKGKA